MSVANFQKFSTPRFYIDYGNFIQKEGEKHIDHLTGSSPSIIDVTSGFGGDPIDAGVSSSSVYKLTSLTPTAPTRFRVKNIPEARIRIRLWTGAYADDFNMVNYFALLGHNLKSAGGRCAIYFSDGDMDTNSGMGNYSSGIGITPIMNSQGSDTDSIFRDTQDTADGTTIVAINNIDSLATDRGDGACGNLGENNECLIYEDRPDICRVDKFYKNFEDLITKKQFYIENTKACHYLIDKHKLDDSYKINIKEYERR